MAQFSVGITTAAAIKHVAIQVNEFTNRFRRIRIGATSNNSASTREDLKLFVVSGTPRLMARGINVSTNQPKLWANGCEKDLFSDPEPKNLTNMRFKNRDTPQDMNTYKNFFTSNNFFVAQL